MNSEKENYTLQQGSNSTGKNMMLRFAIMLIMATSLILLSFGRSMAEIESTAGVMRPTDRIQIITDPRIELLSVVQLLSDYRTPEGKLILTRLGFQYLTEIERRFGEYRGHDAVRRFSAMSKTGFWYSQPPQAMLSLSHPPGLEVERPIDRLVVQRAGGEEALLGFFESLRRFSIESRFVEFYQEQGSFYDEMVRQYQTMVSGFHYVADLEAYYGTEQNSYTIILAPLYHPGGFGIRMESESGSYDVYNISGPYEVTSKGITCFGEESELRRIVWHEFGHSFVNHIVERNLNLFMESASALCADMREKVAAAPNVSWELFIHEWLSEHMVRAVTTRLAYRELGKEAGDLALAKETGQGYYFVGELAKSLQYYEEQREQYPTFASYLPKLADVFSMAVSSED